MQTIDLGTISIGGEDLGAPQTPGTHAGSPFPVPHAGGIASRRPRRTARASHPRARCT